MDAGRAWWEQTRGEEDPPWSELDEERRRGARRRAEAEEVCEEIARLSAAMDGLRARRLELIRRLEELGGAPGFASVRELLGWRVGMTEWDAREEVRVARALGELPEMREAYGRGEVSWSKLRHVSRVAEPDDEGDLLELATEVSGPALRRECKEIRSEKEVARAEENGEMPTERRWVRTSRVDARHARLRAQLLHEEMDLVEKAIEEQRRQDIWADWEACGQGEDSPVDPTAAGGGGPAGEPAGEDEGEEGEEETVHPPWEDPWETAEARRADALLGFAVSWLDREASEGPVAGSRTQLMVHVRRVAGEHASALEEGRLDDGTVLPGEAVQALACDASVVDVTENADGDVVGTGSRKRTIPAATRRALMVRDGGRCRFPGCARTLFVEGHHIVPWSEGGPSTLDNLVVLCTKHHRAIHREEASCEMVDGTPVFRDPLGRRIVEAPERPPVGPAVELFRGDAGLNRPEPTGWFDPAVHTLDPPGPIEPLPRASEADGEAVSRGPPA